MPSVTLPRLVGVVHLPALPGAPLHQRAVREIAEDAARDGEVLGRAGFDAVLVENFGDKPFEPKRVAPVTVAAMTRCALAVRAAAPSLALGINVLRNDAEAALSIALASDAAFVRVNVHTGARLTDQGVLEGRAHETLRLRATLRADVALFCDVDVKHSAALAPRPLAEEAEETADRALADALLVTGTGTGRMPDLAALATVVSAVRVPVYVASGATPETLGSLRAAHGVIVGSWLRADGAAGGPIDETRARAFAEAFRRG